MVLRHYYEDREGKNRRLRNVAFEADGTHPVGCAPKTNASIVEGLKILTSFCLTRRLEFFGQEEKRKVSPYSGTAQREDNNCLSLSDFPFSHVPVYIRAIIQIYILTD